MPLLKCYYVYPISKNTTVWGPVVAQLHMAHPGLTANNHLIYRRECRAMTLWGKEPEIWLQHHSHPIGLGYAYNEVLLTERKPFVMGGVKEVVFTH